MTLKPKKSGLNKSLCPGFLISLAISSLAISSAEAAITQTWKADWTMFENPTGPGSAGNIIPGNASGGGSGGTVNINETLPINSYVKGYTSLNFDKQTGTLKSGTDINAKIIQNTGSGNQGYLDFSFESTNQVSFTDQLTISAGPGGWGSLKVKIKTNGSLQHFGEIVEAAYGFSPTKLDNELSINASLGGNANSISSNISSDFFGLSFGSKSSDADSDIINDEFTLVIPWTSSDPVNFTFDYKEALSFSTDGLDTSYVSFSAKNDFGHTLDLYADVFDQNGNLIENATITSSEGINYQSLAQSQTPVPVPGAFFMFAPALLGFVVLRRRTEQ